MPKQKLNLNKNLEPLFEKIGVSNMQGYVFCLLFEHKLDDFFALYTQLDIGKFARLLEIDVEAGEYALKYPLYEEETSVKDSTKVDEFYLRLKDHLFNSSGHPNNAQDYSVIDKTKETVEVLDQILQTKDVESVVKVVVSYYAKTKPAKKLINYLQTGFHIDYGIS